MPMLLADYVQKHYLAERPGLSPDYERLLAKTVSRLENHAGTRLGLADVDRGLVASFVQRGIDAGLRPATVNGWARMLRTLLSSAFDDGLLGQPPRKLRKLKENLAPPEAWNFDECVLLFREIWATPGWIEGFRAADFWSSLVATVYWTACRIGALVRCEWPDYRPGEGLLVRRQKNGNQQWYPLPESACKLIETLWREDPGRIWPWPYHRNTLWKHFRPIVERAGIPCPRTGRQLFYRLRRTNISYCAAEDPAIAQRQADHADWRTTRDHYVDPRIARERSAADVLQDPMAGPDDDSPSGPDTSEKKPPFRVIG